MSVCAEKHVVPKSRIRLGKLQTYNYISHKEYKDNYNSVRFYHKLLSRSAISEIGPQTKAENLTGALNHTEQGLL